MKSLRKTIQLIFRKNPYEATFCDDGIMVKDMSSNELFTYVETNGMYGLFKNDTTCCNSWRFQPTIEDICLSIREIQTTTSVYVSN